MRSEQVEALLTGGRLVIIRGIYLWDIELLHIVNRSVLRFGVGFSDSL